MQAFNKCLDRLLVDLLTTGKFFQFLIGLVYAISSQDCLDWFSQYFPVDKAKCGTEIIGILADGTVTCCCIDYDGLTDLGNIFSKDLYSILDQNREIIEGLHKTGDLHLDICKRCMGSPTKSGAWFKNIINQIRLSY